MSEPTVWPQRIKTGNVSVSIYRVENKKGDETYVEFRVVFYDADKNRKTKTFSEWDKAKQFTQSVNASITKGDAQSLTLTNDDKLVYVRALSAIKGLNTPLDTAATQYAKAIRDLGPFSLEHAVKKFMDTFGKVQSKTVQKVVDELVEAKRTHPKKPASDVYLKDLEGRLNKFAESFHCNIDSVSPALIEGFLNGSFKGRTWFNYARLIRTLFNYAQLKKYYPRDVDPMEGIVIEHTDEEAIEIFTPKELAKLFEHARDEMVPYLAIAAFAGLRAAELARLDWKHVGPKVIEVTAKGAKTSRRRTIPILPNLEQWISNHRKEAGPIIPFANMSKQLLWLAGEAGIEWKHNALRHSFISYRVQQIQKVSQVALEAGNSEAKIFSNYRELVSDEAATAWFAIQPQVSENVVPMVATA